MVAICILKQQLWPTVTTDLTKFVVYLTNFCLAWNSNQY